MVYVAGIIGFLCGFAFGIGIINLFLRNRSKRELLNDKSLRWTYGVAVWIVAGLGAWAGVMICNRFLY